MTVPIPDSSDTLSRLSAALKRSYRLGTGALFFVVFRSELVRSHFEISVVQSLQQAGLTIRYVDFPLPSRADWLGQLAHDPPLANVVLFINGLGRSFPDVLDTLNYRREIFAEAYLRVVFWVTETELAQIAEKAPDFFRFRREIFELLDSPTPDQQVTIAKQLLDAWQAELDKASEDELYTWQVRGERLVAALPEGPLFATIRAATWLYLANVHWIAFTFQHDLQHLDQVIQSCREAASTAEDAQLYGRTQRLLGEASILRYQTMGDAADVELAASSVQNALLVAPDPALWTTLGTVLNVRHQRTGELSDLNAAIDAFQRAALSAYPSDRPSYLNNLGAALQSRYTQTSNSSDLEQAIQAYQEALTMLPRETQPHEWALTMRNLASAYQERLYGDRAQNLEQAIQAYQEALTAFSRETQPQQWASTMNALGKVYGKRLRGERAQNLEHAIDAHRQAISLSSPSPSRVHYLYDLASAFQALHDLSHKDDDLKRATVNYEQACTVGLDLAPQVALEASEDWGTWAARRLDWPEAAEAFQYGMKAADILLEAQTFPQSDAGWWAKALTLPAHAAYALASMGELETAILTLENGRSRMLAEFLEDRVRSKPLDLMSLRKVLTTDGVGVYLCVVSEGGLAFVVHIDGITAVRMDITEDELNRWLSKNDERGKGYLSALLGHSPLTPILDEVLPIIGAKIVEPVAAALRRVDARSATLIPTGRLAFLPFHAIPYDMDGVSRMLIEEFTVTYASSARALQRSREALVIRPAHPPAFLGVSDSRPEKPLLFARFEVARIAELFGPEATILLEDDASRIRDPDELRRATYLHFAGEPALSGFVLREGNHLTFGKGLADLDLNRTRLATLSISGSALAVPDPEVTMHMTTALLRAGVPGVVGTLWPVNDLSTALLMIRFYNYHLKDGLVPAEALRTAQLWLRDVTNAELSELFDFYRQNATDRPASRMAYETAQAKFREHTLRDPDEKPFAHPYYWAPFVFYGV